MANLTGVHREYGLQRYGMDIEVFWLRILKFVKADAQFYPIHVESFRVFQSVFVDSSRAATWAVATRSQ
jgi:hypothetical protein